MTYGSICSGIEAASVAWHPLGWRCAFLSEIEPFPRAVLQHRWHGTPLHGDFTTIREADYEPIDILVGGTPCQSFSVAGLRGGLADARGNLALEYLRLAARLRPRWVVWENVPGVLSSSGGRDFGAFLGGLAECGYGWAYRVLDAQYFGVAQRRRRVFVVGHLGDWRRAAAVLFESHSLSGHPAPSRESREVVAPCLASRPTGGGGIGTDAELDGALIPESTWPANVAPTLNAHFGDKQGLEDQHALNGAGLFVPVTAHSPRADGFDASEDGTGRGTPLVPVAVRTAQTGVNGQAVCFGWQNSASQGDSCGPVSPALDKSKTPAVATGMAVRRLTPRECERLQGFSDDYTLIPWRGGMAADGPRYKALGNSMAVPVMRWIGERIAVVEAAGKNPAAPLATGAGRA